MVKQYWQRRRNNRIQCLICRGFKFKIVRTHGQKSHGYKVCKDCKEIIR